MPFIIDDVPETNNNNTLTRQSSEEAIFSSDEISNREENQSANSNSSSSDNDIDNENARQISDIEDLPGSLDHSEENESENDTNTRSQLHTKRATNHTITRTKKSMKSTAIRENGTMTPF